MKNRVKDKRYDVGKHWKDTDDEAFTTDYELEDMPAQDIETYRQLRLLQFKFEDVDKQNIELQSMVDQ